MMSKNNMNDSLYMMKKIYDIVGIIEGDIPITNNGDSVDIIKEKSIYRIDEYVKQHGYRLDFLYTLHGRDLCTYDIYGLIDNISQIMRDHNITIGEGCSKIGISRTTFDKFKQGKGNTSITTVVKICKAFDIVMRLVIPEIIIHIN